eukprot:SAG31_NODE_3060_length_4732_cov_2.919706_7_plen_151_part_00
MGEPIVARGLAWGAFARTWRAWPSTHTSTSGTAVTTRLNGGMLPRDASECTSFITSSCVLVHQCFFFLFLLSFFFTVSPCNRPFAKQYGRAAIELFVLALDFWQLDVVEELAVQLFDHACVLYVVHQVHVLAWPVQPLATIASMVVQLSP